MSRLSIISEQNASIKMSSREIAELCEKRLSEILKDQLLMQAIEKGELPLQDAMCVGFTILQKFQECSAIACQNILKANEEQILSESQKSLDNINSFKQIAYVCEKLFSFYPFISKAFSDFQRTAFYLEAFGIWVTYPANHQDQKENSIFTYIVFNPKSNLIKIGKSISPKKRIRTLETQAGAHFEVLALIHGDEESKLHKKFDKYRTIGEWFLDEQGEIRAFAMSLGAEKK
ncbi:GIY-YIG nuclease family protein [Avibacterium paragallinarum]|uniref:T5orf172 domain n=1 Tax=Avibacterium paragallinarum TaxID=728 RepID=A0A0F5EV28_AVIPA|nr:GIY-YIG nuclease family protein [Avibacterium paragallinarum]KKB00220.1 hypothetical protein Z012_11625 [Avibacterium paragallinarum]SUU97560.1 T5orf172 domain [Avibacterium paragallinarum]